MGVVSMIFQPDVENASEISDHDLPNDIPESMGSKIAEGGHGIRVTKFAFSFATELQAESDPS
ncbi:MAG TPA: hypothetical protein QF716_05465, partial [Candidatus Thalassarchaeaceae archaeon]|nr:hypothetical protein [Candidatus Thalassarchaeaceae archaeon]